MALTLGDGVGVLNLQVRTNQRFNPLITLTQADSSPVNLSGCSVASQIRKKSTDANPVLVMTVSIVGDGTLGQIQYNTDFSTVAPGAYLYDIVVTDSLGVLWNILGGTITVTGGITK